MYTNTLFMIVRIIQAATILNIRPAVVVMNMFNVVTWTVSSAFATNTLFHTKEMAEFINQFMKTYVHFQSKSKNVNFSRR